MSSGLYQIEKLDDDNYDSWAIQMRSVLIHCDLWAYVSGTIEKPPADRVDTVAAWTVKDEKALATLTLSVKTAQLIHIKNCRTSAVAWTTLKDIHRPTGPARKVTVFKQLINLKMVEGAPISAHINSFFGLTDKLGEIDIKLPDELITIILLSSLPKSYENFVVAIESRDELPKAQALKGKLLEEGNRRADEIDVNTPAVNDGESAFYLKQRHPQTQQHYNKPQPHTQQQQHSKSHDNSQQVRGKCYKCGKRGHYASSCKSSAGSSKNNAAYTMLNAAGSVILKRNMWVLDSGSTCHMCCDKTMFDSLSAHQEKIQLAGDKHIFSESIGTVSLTTDTTHIQLKNVLYVPSLTANFMSMSKATDSNYTVKFDNKYACITDKCGAVILKANKCGNLYVYCTESECLFNTNTLNTDYRVWHERYGHLNAKSLNNIIRNDLVRGIDIKAVPAKINCDVCAKGKMCSLPFGSNSAINSKAVLDLVHSDICGPMRTTSLGGCKYFALFIDDFSRKIFIHFLKQKSDVLDAFKAFKSRVERQTGMKIKTLRSDNGCEYVSGEFSRFLQSEGIQRQLTVQYTPQQNGVAERANRTLVEMARCLLISSGLPESLWAEAVNTAVYLRNRSPTKLLQQTPYELWCGSKPSVHHLRTFGSKVFALEKRPGKSKFAAKGIECAMVGYSPESKAYRLYNPATRQVIKSRDVKFMEDCKSACSSNDDYVIVEQNVNNAPAHKAPPAFKNETESDDDIDDIVFDDAVSEAGDGGAGDDDAIDAADDVVAGENVAANADEGGIDEEVAVSIENVPRRRIGSSVSSHPMSLRKRQNLLYTDGECVSNPMSINDALSRIDKHHWLESMKAEYKSLIQNKTWELVDLPNGRRPIGCKWVFTMKHDKHGKVERYKSRLVAKGCAQRYGVDYTETFSPVVRYSSLRLIFALAAEYDLQLHQMDVSTAYLNGELNETVYMVQPERFVCEKYPHKVCKLNKSLYGLKQSGREWNCKLDSVLKSIGFKPCHADTCVYTLRTGRHINIIAVYVDDIMLACSNLNDLCKWKREIGRQFDVVDKGPVDYFLGMEISRNDGEINVSHKHFIEELLTAHNMLETRKTFTPLDPGQKFKKCAKCSPACALIDAKEYQSIIGSLMYLGVSTRPDIAHSVSKLAQFNNQPHEEHWTAVKHLLRYLNNTMHSQLSYCKTGKSLMAFADADWAGSCDDRKSYTGYLLALAGAPITWESRKQATVALSSTEAEYMALCAASKEVVYIRNFLSELGFGDLVHSPTIIFGDNISSHQLVKNPVYHARSKHIDIRVHYIREIYKKNLIELKYVPTEENLADIFTKNLNKPKHTHLTHKLGLF